MDIPNILMGIGLIFSIILIANLIISIFSRIHDKLKKREGGPTLLCPLPEMR